MERKLTKGVSLAAQQSKTTHTNWCLQHLLDEQINKPIWNQNPQTSQKKLLLNLQGSALTNTFLMREYARAEKPTLL